mmetsp:Transcript_11434/g.28522  ORF Transcript_11434/g.28522 Transcript_11434/m.28522 type:complete len:109 (-) Transcript_11434:1453-1779(-)
MSHDDGPTDSSKTPEIATHEWLDYAITSLAASPAAAARAPANASVSAGEFVTHALLRGCIQLHCAPNLCQEHKRHDCLLPAVPRQSPICSTITSMMSPSSMSNSLGVW